MRDGKRYEKTKQKSRNDEKKTNAEDTIEKTIVVRFYAPSIFESLLSTKYFDDNVYRVAAKETRSYK